MFIFSIYSCIACTFFLAFWLGTAPITLGAFLLVTFATKPRDTKFFFISCAGRSIQNFIHEAVWESIIARLLKKIFVPLCLCGKGPI